MSDEEYVRANWENPIYEHTFSGHTIHPRPYLDIPQLSGFEKKLVAWASAAEFTRARLEQIRQLEEEIEWVNVTLGLAYSSLELGGQGDAAGTSLRLGIAVNERILARLESALSDLKRGMKPAP